MSPLPIPLVNTNGMLTSLSFWLQFAARPAGFRCPAFEDRIQSYCESPDPFCSNGDDPDTHQGYGFQFGKEALDFIVSKLVTN